MAVVSTMYTTRAITLLSCGTADSTDTSGHNVIIYYAHALRHHSKSCGVNARNTPGPDVFLVCILYASLVLSHLISYKYPALS